MAGFVPVQPGEGRVRVMECVQLAVDAGGGIVRGDGGGVGAHVVELALKSSVPDEGGWLQERVHRVGVGAAQRAVHEEKAGGMQGGKVRS